jgi:2-polyprenyl-3-methyl-5-hydroxy-6-metoxy-1,4-benzoquinol methylase
MDMSTVPNMTEESKVEHFVKLTVNDIGAALNSVLVVIGDKLGLYKAMAEAGPLTSVDLAKKTGTNERYIREWLAVQVCSRYITYDTHTKLYTLPKEHALVLADENSPHFVVGAFQHLIAATKIEDKLLNAFRTGEGIDWRDHDNDVFVGEERFSRPAYEGELVSRWIPSLEGNWVEKLQKGAKVADIGCGFGVSTIIMANAFPNSKFFGFDYHKTSVEEARRRAIMAGVQNNTSFQVATSTDFPGDEYDLLTFFDSLHDMGDPIAAGRYARAALKSDGGTCMIVEVSSSGKLEDNMNPLGRALYAASIFICLPASLAQGGPGFGLVVGEEKFSEIIMSAGFKSFRRAYQSSFHNVFEAKP